MMTGVEWARCVLILRSTYPTSFKLDADGIDVWFTMLEDLPGPAVQAAIIHMGRTTKAFPSIAEIREHADPNKGDHSAAWGELLREMRREGYCGSPQFSDPHLPEVVKRLGGWAHICQTMMTADEATWRAQFRNAYNDLAAKVSRDRTFKALGVVPVTPALPEGA